jgi:methylmalonyl-CoA epimerase
MIKGINHIAIAVKNVDEAISFYQDTLGLKASEIKTIPEQAVKVAFIPLGEVNLELVEPLDPQSGVAKFLEQRGEGLHHICFEVDNVNQELKSLAEKGVSLIDKEARRGAEGMVAFLHPKSTRGVLCELVQRV